MLKARACRLITVWAAGALTFCGAGSASAAPADSRGVRAADDGGGMNPVCILQPQDCMYPPDNGRNGDGNPPRSPDANRINPMCMLRPQDCMYPPDRRKGGDGGGMNPLCMFRPQDCWPPPGYDGTPVGQTAS